MDTITSLDFEDIPADRKKILCRLCTTHRGRGVVIIQRNSKASHLSSKKHAAAVASHRQLQAGSTEELPRTQSQSTGASTREPAVLDRMGRFDLKDTDQEMGDETQGYNLFAGYQCDDGLFIGSDHQEIVFSAGILVDEEEKNTRTILQEQIDNLNLVQEHSLFGHLSESVWDMDFQEMVRDPTVSDLSIAIEEMGEHWDEKGGESSLDGLCSPNDFSGIGEETDVEEEDEGVESSKVDCEWAPYESRTMFMLDLLDNLPRLRLSDDHMKMILFVMQECRTPDVPSFSALRKVQENLSTQFDLKTKHHISAMGSHFYMNHPAKLLALDWSNPLVREMIHVYPEINGPISESWQAAKWAEEVSLDELSPMWADWENPATRHRQFYVKELARLRDQSFVIPLRWITIGGVVHAEVLDAIELTDNKFHVRTGAIRRIPALALYLNVIDIVASIQAEDSNNGNIQFSEYSPIYEMPNPLREIARGCPLFRLRIMPWSDDVSGNVSKQYNAHTNVYITNSSIPHRALSQEYFVRFCSTSPYATSSEQFVALKDDFDPSTWNKAYDCKIEMEIMFQIMPHLLPADNPQQSETSSHIGVNGNLNSRRDLTGGTDEEKESVEGYRALYKVGVPRTIESTIQTIRYQIWIACSGNNTVLQSTYSQTGVKDKISQFWIEQLLAKFKEYRKQYITDTSSELHDVRLTDQLKGQSRKTMITVIEREIQLRLWNWVITQPTESYNRLMEDDDSRNDLRPGDHYNILLATRGIDVHQDTPVEILHTYLLGNDKYVWHETNKVWDKRKDELFAIRLQSSNVNGLSIPPPRARYMIQYKNSLIGKHFRTLQQIGVFHLHELCSDEVFQLWKATGELGALIWFVEIVDMESYLADLQILIDNLLDRWARVDPRRIMTKMKLRTLLYLVDDVRRFGPAVLYATEVFECFNVIFRLCSILSNHLAPSRDIATALGSMERVKHIISGGWWKSSADDNAIYRQAGPKVRSYLLNTPNLQRRLGWAEGSALKPGAVKLASRAKRNPSKWDALSELFQFNVTEPNPCSETWVRCEYVASCSGDRCSSDSWVFLQWKENTWAGQIIVILSPTSAPLAPDGLAIIVQLYDVDERKDVRLNMPVLSRSVTQFQPVILRAKDLLFSFNAQHDCVKGRCSIRDDIEHDLQERMETSIPKKILIHSQLDRHFVNMHALHNAHLIRETLPRHLTMPIPFLDDRVSAHKKLADELQISGPVRRAASRKKAAETRARNQAKKASHIPMESIGEEDCAMEG